ncbi:MAG: hypothetical protein BWY70_00208 [Bacteroidetes bacterium ADurb.Bin408]|nr:MAG: hypothetical protein BWY70_00208 [Bacteroidetes bacterium ADurb.Bin408]
MKKIILAFMLIIFAVCSYGAEYKVVFFKVNKIIKKGNIQPNVSEELMKLAKVGQMVYTDKDAYIFAVIPSNTNDLFLALFNGLKPLSKAEELLYAKNIELINLNCDYENGVKARPVYNSLSDVPK